MHAIAGAGPDIAFLVEAETVEQAGGAFGENPAATDLLPVCRDLEDPHVRGMVVANVCFGGSKLNDLYIAGTTSLYMVRLMVNGAKTY